MAAVDPIIKQLMLMRLRRGWTQTQVSEMLGHDGNAVIQRWEAGNAMPKLPNLAAWAELFGHEIALVRKEG